MFNPTLDCPGVTLVKNTTEFKKAWTGENEIQSDS